MKWEWNLVLNLASAKYNLIYHQLFISSDLKYASLTSLNYFTRNLAEELLLEKDDNDQSIFCEYHLRTYTGDTRIFIILSFDFCSAGTGKSHLHDDPLSKSLYESLHAILSIYEEKVQSVLINMFSSQLIILMTWNWLTSFSFFSLFPSNVIQLLEIAQVPDEHVSFCSIHFSLPTCLLYVSGYPLTVKRIQACNGWSMY